jgi:hypothetical protein
MYNNKGYKNPAKKECVLYGHWQDGRDHGKIKTTD